MTSSGMVGGQLVGDLVVATGHHQQQQHSLQQTSATALQQSSIPVAVTLHQQSQPILQTQQVSSS